MPMKLNLVINRGQYNQVYRPTISINNGVSRNSAVQSQAPPPPPPPPTPPANPLPPGISMRRAINAPKNGCKSCRG
jgi:hypothetical protein